MLFVVFMSIYYFSTKRRNNVMYFPHAKHRPFSDVDTDVRYLLLDLWSLPLTREATRHASKVSAPCAMLRL